MKIKKEIIWWKYSEHFKAYKWWCSIKFYFITGVFLHDKPFIKSIQIQFLMDPLNFCIKQGDLLSSKEHMGSMIWFIRRQNRLYLSGWISAMSGYKVTCWEHIVKADLLIQTSKLWTKYLQLNKVRSVEQMNPCWINF